MVRDTERVDASKNVTDKNAYILILFLSTIACAILVLSTKGIHRESTISLNGDMPRYMMNGVFFYDLFRDLPLKNPVEYAIRYYSRYPALSIGHHPILLGVAEAPFYGLFGISVFSARLTIIAFTLLGAVFWYLLIHDIYGGRTAFISALLLFTTPFVVEHYRIVMSEVPGVSLIIITTYFFYRYRTSRGKKLFVSFVAFFILSILARPQTIFMGPVFLGCYLMSKKSKSLLLKKKNVIAAGTVLATLVLVMFITVKYSPANFSWITDGSIGSRLAWANVSYYLTALWKFHLTLPVLIASIFGISLALINKDKRAILFGLWILCSYLLITATGAQTPRYNIYWIPPFCLFAAAMTLYLCSSKWRACSLIVLYLVSGYQFAVAFQEDPGYAAGYEEVAKYVIDNKKKGQSVLVSTAVDTGYFTFFVRKHDPKREMVVLRADKVLATSSMRHIVEERIAEKKEIYDILQDFGVYYVVIEDMEYASAPLEWLREELRSENFTLQKRIPVNSDKPILKDVTLAVYRYKNYTNPKPGKLLKINLPLVRKSITIPFDDLFRNGLQ